jgi:methyltransferase (TIGR00027 family)
MTEPARATAPPLSKTAVYVTAGRAIGAREPDPEARNPDYLAEPLLGDVASLNIDHPAIQALELDYEEAMKSMEVVNAVRMMTVRTRFIDDVLHEAMAEGAEQLVILGAGFDTHAYRYRELLSRTRVFEVDRAPTQTLKRHRVEQVLGAPPENLSYVTADLADDLGAVLAEFGYSTARRTLFVMEGVTMYLPERVFRQTLGFVGRHPAGSRIVFDFVSQPMVEMLQGMDRDKVPTLARPFIDRFRNLIEDEPWIFGVPVGGEEALLDAHALEAGEHLAIGGEESARRYLTRRDGTQVGGETIASAAAAYPTSPADASQRQSRSPGQDKRRWRERLMPYQILEARVARRH